MRTDVRVRHQELGNGVVVALLSRRAVPGAEVDFGYVVEWVPLAELAPVAGDIGMSEEGPLAGDEATVSWKPVPELPDDVVRARRAILALKLGQVLEEDVHQLSVGTDNVEAELKRAVVSAARRRPVCVLVSGAYGAGKTHLLTILSSLAVRERLATASVILDGEGITLSEPMAMMGPILRSLRFPDESASSGVVRRLAALRKRGVRWRGGRRRTSRITEALSHVPTGSLDDPDVLEVLEDYLTTSLPASHAKAQLRKLVYRRVDLPSMKAQRIDERATRFADLLEDWADFCVAAGGKGLVVIFDEVDVEYARTLWRIDSRRRRRFLLDEIRDLLGYNIPLLIAFASAPAADAEAENDAVVDLTRSIPEIRQIHAPRPDLEQTRQLGRGLLELYARAYPDRMSGIDLRALEHRIDEHAEEHSRALHPTPRKFVRRLLECFDVEPNLPESRYEV